MFANFVSLGPYCFIAASMAKYGLRSWSGPFDWLITTDLKWVLYFIENDFESFLRKEDLERWNGDPRAFKNIRSGFGFVHERDYLFEEQYDEIHIKYMRRIERFITETQKTTCFLRFIYSREEAEYIERNSDYVRKTIKKRNSDNEIVFLTKEELYVEENFPFKIFFVPDFREGMAREIQRGAFDSVDNFLRYCASNYDARSMMRNLLFDRKQEDKIYMAQKYDCEVMRSKYKICSSRYNLLLKLLNYDFNDYTFQSRIVIYGAGNIGRIFYHKVKEKTEVVCFVDKEKAGQEVDGIKVVTLDEIECSDVTIIVTPTYDFDNICRSIVGKNSAAIIVSLEDIIK